MKNKIFVPVPVSERLPEKTTPVIGIYGNSYALLYVDSNGWWWKIGEHSSHPCPLYWLEEREDRTAELVEMLKRVGNLLADIDSTILDHSHSILGWHFNGDSEPIMNFVAEWDTDAISACWELITSIEKGESND